MEDAAPSPRRADRLSWAVFLVLAVIYRWGRCPSFGGGDSPAVVYHALFGPVRDFFSAVAWLAARLPFDSREGNVNALSGLFHAGAATLLFATLRRLGIKRVPALAAVSLLSFSRHYWYYSLVAGYRPAIVFGLALAIWGTVAWKDEARAWPLAYSVLGLLFLALSPTYIPADPPLYIYLYLCVLHRYFPPGLIIPTLWIAALLGALLLQRIEDRSPILARLLLAAAFVIPIARPYSLRSHNPTLEWAQAATASAGKDDAFRITDFGLKYAIAYVMRTRFPEFDADRHAIGGFNGAYFAPPPHSDWHDIRWDLWNPQEPGFAPKGLLLHAWPSWNSSPPPTTKPTIPIESELAKRASDVLEMPALSSIGRRDRKKYGFTPESVLYEEYRGILTRYRELLPNHPELRARLDAQLAEYAEE